MKTFLDCYPCFLRQALESARMAGADEQQQQAIMDGVLSQLLAGDPGCTPPEIGYGVHSLVREITGCEDPYREAKTESTLVALSLVPEMEELLAEATDPLETAVKLAIAGNVIDFGPPDHPSGRQEIRAAVDEALQAPFALDDLARLRDKLEAAESVLYLGDNAGETVCDRLFIEYLAKPTRYVVKGGPVLNDATRMDAQQAGVSDVAEIIDTSLQAPGVILDLCSTEFREAMADAEVVIAKGQANYETLSTFSGPIFFLLKAKCPVIARDLGVPTGAVVCRAGQSVRQRVGVSRA